MTKETKTLSQQICELCGIKPRRVKPLLCEIKGYKHLTCEFCVEEAGKCKTEKKVYPDFENPENFVRLLELETEPNQATVWCLVNTQARHFYKHTTYSRKTFLSLLKVILENDPKTTSDEQIELIKQSIRDYDGWVWG